MSIPLWLSSAITMYGYWAILVAVALETMGVPFPGETSLLAGAVYAGTGASINIVGVIAAAAAGAILGDNVGFTVGYFGGYPLLRRIATVLHIDAALLGYAQRFFERHGDKTVLIGRFFSILRVWVAFLAGANRMPRRVFFVWNATGGILWAMFYGALGYFLGRNLPLLGSVLQALGIGGAIVIVAFIVILISGWIVQGRRTRARVRAAPPATPESSRPTGGESATTNGAASNGTHPLGSSRHSGSMLVKLHGQHADKAARAAGQDGGPPVDRRD